MAKKAAGKKPLKCSKCGAPAAHAVHVTDDRIEPRCKAHMPAGK